MAPVHWDSQGWPVVNKGNPVTFDMPGLYDLARPKVWRDDFAGGKLKDKAYYTARTPYKAFHSLDTRPGWLRLRGNLYTLSDRETPAAFFRKQVDLETVWSTEVDFHPTSTRHEAGVTIYLSIWYHDEIAVTTHPEDTNRRVVVARTRSGPEVTVNETYRDIPSEGTVKLFIKAERDKYSLGYALSSNEPDYIAVVDSKW